MEKRRIVSVRELVKMFVAISYLQEQRIIKAADIWDYIDKNSKHSSVDSDYLWEEVDETIEELITAGILRTVYQYGSIMFRVSDKINILEIAKYPKDYLQDMTEVFFDIIGAKKRN